MTQVLSAHKNDTMARQLVRPEPTAYGHATLGAKPFRRAPFRNTVWNELG